MTDTPNAELRTAIANIVTGHLSPLGKLEAIDKLFQAREQQLLRELLPDGRNLSTSAYGLWVQHELETRLLQNKTNDGGSDGDSNITAH